VENGERVVPTFLCLKNEIVRAQGGVMSPRAELAFDNLSLLIGVSKFYQQGSLTLIYIDTPPRRAARGRMC
jgi:hypothetical protein